MLIVIEKGFGKELTEIFHKWDLDCTEVGVVTDTGNLEVWHKGNIVAKIPSEELVLGGGAPQYDMPTKEPAYFNSDNQLDLEGIKEPSDSNDILLQLLSAQNITSKLYVYRQYDSTVRTNTMQGPGGDGAVIRLKGTDKGLAMSTDCNSRYVYLNPNGESAWENSYNPMFLSATQDVVPVDYNNDGQLDMFTPGLLIAHGQEVDAPGYKYTSLLYKNISNDSTAAYNNWINLTLEGKKNDLINNGWTLASNHSAIGARVIVHLFDKNISREIIAGKGHGSMDPLRLHYGLGNSTFIDGITIKWPSKDTLTNSPKISYYQGPIESNKNYRIVENLGFVGQKGDANYDENVNVLDVVILVDNILSP